jgi:ferredoxin
MVRIMNVKTEETYTVRLYLSGPVEVAKQVLREECMREGLCVTIEPTTYIYTGGEEAGYVVGGERSGSAEAHRPNDPKNVSQGERKP